MPRVGLVVAVDDVKNMAQISTSLRGVCENCGESASCSMDQGGSGGANEVLWAENVIHAKEGDSVEFDLRGHIELKISLIVWIVPLIGLILGIFCSGYFQQWLETSEDVSSLLGAFSGFAIAFAGVMIYDRSQRHSRQLVPQVTRILANHCHMDQP